MQEKNIIYAKIQIFFPINRGRTHKIVTIPAKRRRKKRPPQREAADIFRELFLFHSGAGDMQLIQLLLRSHKCRSIVGPKA
jgi:hypothetical protein